MNYSIINKVLLQLLLLLFLSIASYAQKGMNIQIMVNPGMSMGGKYQLPQDVTSANTGWVAEKKSFTFGMDAGAAFGYNFADEMGVLIGLLYSKQGQNYKDYTWTMGTDKATWQRKVSLNYLKIPLQFIYILNPDQKISFTGSAGIYLAFLLGYNDKNSANATDGSSFTSTAKGSTLTQTSTDSQGTTTQSATFINGKPYKSADFGGIIGVGVQFKVSDKITIPVGIYYQIGFVDVKNKACQFTQTNSSNAQLFWQNANNNSPNATQAYHNSSLEIKIAAKVNL